MRRDNTFDPGKAKKIARIKYAERKVNSYIDWSIIPFWFAVFYYIEQIMPSEFGV